MVPRALSRKSTKAIHTKSLDSPAKSTHAVLKRCNLWNVYLFTTYLVGFQLHYWRCSSLDCIRIRRYKHNGDISNFRAFHMLLYLYSKTTEFLFLFFSSNHSFYCRMRSNTIPLLLLVRKIIPGKVLGIRAEL
jgi:hypothetical protein